MGSNIKQPLFPSFDDKEEPKVPLNSANSIPHQSSVIIPDKNRVTGLSETAYACLIARIIFRKGFNYE
jgi:hypothetical protein